MPIMPIMPLVQLHLCGLMTGQGKGGKGIGWGGSATTQTNRRKSETAVDGA